MVVVEPTRKFFEALIDFFDERGISRWLRHGFKLVDDLQDAVFQIAEVGNVDRGRCILQMAHYRRELFRQDVKIDYAGVLLCSVS